MAGEVKIMEAFQTLAKSTVVGAVTLDQLLEDVLKSLRSGDSARRLFRQRITGEKLRCEAFAEFLLRLREHLGAFRTRNIDPPGDRPRSEKLRDEISTVSRAKLNCDPTSHLSRLLEEVLRLRTEKGLSPPIE